MFSLSAKGTYGLTALLELGLQRDRGAIQIRDISKKHGIPQHYLEQILVMLKRAGFVESFRGAQGGYALAQDPDQIRVHDVLARLEGQLEVVNESRREGALSFYWTEIQNQLSKVLDRSLGDLIRERDVMDERVDYVI